MQDLHGAAIELIEVPSPRMSGKNSADIRMVVDAMDLCYSKDHIDAFVIISGDSDFSPLVSKLRENDKTVIGIGLRGSTSELLVSNCDEFIFYDDLVREKPKGKHPQPRRKASKTPAADSGKRAAENRTEEALDLILETIDALVSERGEEGKIWGSMVKQALKRRKPGFNEAFYGFRSFNDLLEEAEAQNLIELERAERSGGYIVRLVEGDN
ncbi:MAG: NYN domain-containing protein, partial [Planctomycetes bacterium]|nr:NYN domain-containing protein [Planctomycetota bacterium]